MKKDVILITGCAGFIGSNLVDRLIDDNYEVVGIDNFNDYYDPVIKKNNIAHAQKNKNFTLFLEDILNFKKIQEIFSEVRPDMVIHLAARAGVRASINAPLLYSTVNIQGTVNLLKLSVDFNVKKFVFGSSSSVYGNSKDLPFSEESVCDSITSPYAASKKAAEFWVEVFWKSYGLNSVILRFFTVYGPRGRPDMSPALFTNAVLNGEFITQFGDGTSSRDYTYIDDIIEGIIKVINTNLDFEIINLGGYKPILLSNFIGEVEKSIGLKAKIRIVNRYSADVDKTWANIKKAETLLKWKPRYVLSRGMAQYINWVKSVKGNRL